MKNITTLDDYRRLLLEHVRSSMITTWVKCLTPGFILLLFKKHIGLIFPAYIIFVGSLIAIYRSYVAYKNEKDEFHETFKENVIQEVIKDLDSGLVFRPKLGISSTDFKASQIFNKYYDRYHSEALVNGIVGTSHFEYSLINTESRNTIHDSKGRMRNTWQIIFKGFFFKADFPTSSGALVNLRPNYSNNFFGRLFQRFQRKKAQGTQMDTNDQVFNKYFKVYTKNNEEAQSILTSALKVRLVQLRLELDQDVYISFYNNKIYIAFDYDNTHMNAPSILRSVDSKKIVKAYEEYFNIGRVISEQLTLVTPGRISD